MGCGCLIVLLGSAFPRVALILTWIFSDLVDRAFTTWALPFIGLIFLPYTTLFYVLAYAPVAGVSAIGWIFVIFGLFLDLGSYAGGGRYGRERYSH